MTLLSWENARIREIKENPGNHRHIDLGSLVNCCFTPEGIISKAAVDAHYGLALTCPKCGKELAPKESSYSRDYPY